MSIDPVQASELALANRILFQQGIVDAYGHVALRSRANPERFLLARSMAPAIVSEEDILELDLDGAVVGERARKSYLERFIHSEIFRQRPDVQAVVHSHSPSVIPWGITPAQLQPVYHMSAFLAGGVPVFDIRDVVGHSDMLIRDAKLGAALARTLGKRPAALLRGHGMVAVGATLKQAVYRAVYLEMNARLQLEAMRLGPVTYLSAEEGALAEESGLPQLDRPWDLWTRMVKNTL